MMTMPALRDAPRLVLLLKSGPGSGAKIAHQSGYAFYGSPARWHKITVEKPAPKGAPVASHPEAAGKHAPAEHLAATEWQSLQLPETNVNAPSYNKALAKLKEWSDAGNVTAIVGAGYGSNTYGQKLAKIANHLLALHGSPHKVTAGQKAGTHAATMGAEPAKAAPLPDLDSPEDMAANHGPAAAKPPKLHTSGISSFMVMDGHNVKIAAVDQKEGGGYALFIDDEYKGHFSNAGSAQAEAHQTIYASDEPAPAGEYGIKSAKQGNLGAEGSVHTVYAPDFSGIEAALGLEPGDLSDTDSTTYVVTNHKGQTFHVYKHGGALSVRVAGANQDHASAAELADWLKGKAQASGPKEGDTKPGADGGTLVLKDGHWVKQGGEAPAAEAAPASQAATNLSMIPWDKQLLPDSNSNAGSHNKAVGKIKAMAEAGDKAGLQAFIDGKAGAKQTYAKKQALLAQTALAALGGEATAAVPLQQPAPAQPAEKPADNGYGPVAPKTKEFKATGTDMVVAYNTKNIAALQSLTAQLASSDHPDAQAWYAYGGQALAALGVAHVPKAGDAPKYPLVNEWKQALAAGKHPTKEQAEAYEALVESDPDAAMEYFMDAVNANVAPDDFDDDKFDEALEAAHSKVHEMHGQALFGKAPKPARVVTADTPLTDGQKSALEKLGKQELEVLAGDDQPLPPNVKAAIKKKLADMQPPAAPKTATAVKTTLHNTLPGHNKSWSVHVAPNASGGFDMVAEYGKIGGTQQKTVKSFPTADAAQAAAEKLKKEKLSKGYAVHNTDYGHKVVVPAAVEQGPKEGDTKQGADGLLVLKDGHWVKMDTGDDGAGDWAYNAEDPGMSGAPTIGNHEGLVAYLPGQGAEFHTDESMMANTGEPALQAENLQGLVQKMAAAGYQVPPLAMLKKLDPSFKMPAGAKAKAVSPAAPAVEPMDSWVQTGGQGGSNPGGKFKDASGQEWYVKWPDDAEAVKSEILAAKLYALAGLSSQDAKLVTKGGKTAIATKWVNIKKAGSAAALAKVDGVHSGFAVDAWLGNWDVVGLSLDNLQIGPDGKAHRVDAGGSLEYRAQGEKKPFGASVDEIDTLRDAKKNAKAAAVFGKMTKADIAASVAKVAAIEDSAIRAMVFEHGPGDDAAKKKLADTLIARKEDLLKRYPEAAKPKKKPLDPKALPVDPKSLPKPHDFENWNGPGKGLSSKDFVNKANAVAEYQMLALAQAGNMVALRDYKFQEVDKNTGAPTGKMLPVSQHPSKHVLQFQQDLLQVLEEVANPPEPLKVFRATEVGSLAALNAAFPPKKFGTTVSKVASNEKLGFWVALGAVGNPSKFKPKKVSNYTAAAIEAAKAKYQKASQLAKHFISSVQASGSYNDLFRDGKTHDHQGNSLKDVAKAALEHATEMPEGTSVYRWQKMSPQMLEHIMSAKEGTVFQATGPMCTSYSPTATKGFGTHRVTIRYAKGAKAVESFASGGFASEKEVTTLPNARFVILSKEMVPDVEHGNPSSKRLELEILMLPPDLGI